MKKVIHLKNPWPNLLVRAGAFAEAALFLLTCGCMPKREEASATMSSNPVEAVQLEKKEEISAGASSTPPVTETPMDASLITPEIVLAPYIIEYINNEEMNSIAESFLNDINANKLPESENYFKQTNEDLIIIIKMLLGDFSIIYDYYKISGEGTNLSNKKEELYYYMRNFCINCSSIINERAYKIMMGEDMSIIPLSISSRYTEDYSGRETLASLENMKIDFFSSINVEDEFKIKAQKIQSFLYDVYSNNKLDNNITAFEDMHPLVKLEFSQTAISLLTNIYRGSCRYPGFEVTSGEGNNLSTLGLADKYDKANLKDGIITLMSDFIEAYEKGEITVVENNDNEAESKPNVPIYTPSN